MSNRDEIIEEAKAFCYRYPNPPENWDIRGISETMVDFALDHANRENARLCLLLADIRSALGDPEGKMMQEDFVQHCKEVVEWLNKLDFADWKGGAIKNRGEYGRTRSSISK